jgi:hypothetical protein
VGGKKALANSSTRIEALQLQSSAYGVVIPVVGGVTRVAGNLIYYNDFTSTPASSKSAGKGGGSAPSSFNYTANCIMAICHGQIADIPRVWKGSAKYPDATGSGAVLAAAAPENYAVPSIGGTYAVAHSAQFGANTSVTATLTTPGQPNSHTVTLSEGVDYTVTNGNYTFALTSHALGTIVTIAYTYLTSVPSNSAMTQLVMTMMKGTLTQAAPSWLTTLHPSDAMGYTGMAGVNAQNYPLDSSGSFENHNFEVVASGAYSIGSTIPDIDPSAFAVKVIVDANYGAAFPSVYVGDTSNWSQYCIANNFLFSPCLDTQQSASDFLTQMAQLTNTGIVWSGSTLKFVPYGDTAITGNGVTWTPNTTPIYSLTDDVFITTDGDPPVQVTRSNPSTAYNDFRVQFKNRSNEYATEIAEAKDDANIAAYTLRQADIVTADWICDGNVARNVAQTMLQRSVYIRATYAFSLPLNFAFLEPMDLVNITDSTQGFVNYTVRITEVSEQDGKLDFTAEDFLLGVAHTATYATQIGAGFVHDFNAIPGSVTSATIFEAPRALSSKNGLDVWIAATSTSTTWGGANVWLSLDGANYRLVGELEGSSRMGTVTTDLGTTLGIQGMSDALVSGSAADAANLTTLCYVGGATPEYLAYQTATLTGSGAYTLGSMNRPAYGTTSTVHPAGTPFVRCDTAVLKALSLDATYVGKTLFLKFTSVNQYGGAEEELANVLQYTYTVTGAQLSMPPTAPTVFTAVTQPFGIFMSCTAAADPTIANYQYRSGPTWATASVIEPAGGTSFLWKVQQAGNYTLWVAAVDTFGNLSTPQSAVASVSVPTVTGLVASIVGNQMELDWNAVAGSFLIADYEVRYGASFALGTSAGFYSTASYSENIKWTVPRTYWVAAVDVNGNYGGAASVVVSPVVPGPVTSVRIDVVDNNALIYWAPPLTGTFPVDHYEVRKGSSWAAGTLIGSNGNSTFTTVFEQVAGTYTYWITAWDTAGNMGTPVSQAATILQPPDYVLRVNYNSGLTLTTPPGVLSATVASLYFENGALVGPVDLTQTWASHFVNNGWASPDAQVSAGYAIYAEPSTASGSYTEVFDYGVVLQATTVTITPTYTIVAGSESLSCQIYTSTDNSTYTAASAGWSALCSNFRYIKYVVTATGVPGANLVELSGINVKLSIKQRTDSGQGISTAPSAVTVTFGYPFIEADYPQVQCGGLDSHGKPWVPAVVYSGPPNPTTFQVLVFDSTGVETAGVPFSWTARGY